MVFSGEVCETRPLDIAGQGGAVGVAFSGGQLDLRATKSFPGGEWRCGHARMQGVMNWARTTDAPLD